MKGKQNTEHSRSRHLGSSEAARPSSVSEDNRRWICRDAVDLRYTELACSAFMSDIKHLGTNYRVATKSILSLLL